MWMQSGGSLNEHFCSSAGICVRALGLLYFLFCISETGSLNAIQVGFKLKIHLPHQLPGVVGITDRHGLCHLGLLYFWAHTWPVKTSLANGSLLYWKETCQRHILAKRSSCWEWVDKGVPIANLVCPAVCFYLYIPSHPLPPTLPVFLFFFIIFLLPLILESFQYLPHMPKAAGVIYFSASVSLGCPGGDIYKVAYISPAPLLLGNMPVMCLYLSNSHRRCNSYGALSVSSFHCNLMTWEMVAGWANHLGARQKQHNSI